MASLSHKDGITVDFYASHMPHGLSLDCRILCVFRVDSIDLDRSTLGTQVLLSDGTGGMCGGWTSRGCERNEKNVQFGQIRTKATNQTELESPKHVFDYLYPIVPVHHSHDQIWIRSTHRIFV